jgi:hypothetical protein
MYNDGTLWECDMAWIVFIAWVFCVYKTAFRLRDASAEGEKSATLPQSFQQKFPCV